MPDNFILQQWDAQTEVFIGSLVFVRQQPSRKVSHNMRVSIKKLRNYLQLCNELNKDAEKIEFTGITTLFRTTGRFRDIEMSLVIIRRHTKAGCTCPPSFI